MKRLFEAATFPLRMIAFYSQPLPRPGEAANAPLAIFSSRSRRAA